MNSPDTNRARLVGKTKPTESFFNFFTPPILPFEEAISEGDFDPDGLKEIEKIVLDYHIDEDIKEKVLVRSNQVLRQSTCFQHHPGRCDHENDNDNGRLQVGIK